jgi:hypothetical protein
MIIVPKVFDNFVAHSEEKSLFGTDYDIFTTRLLVRIVSNQHAHSEHRAGR